MNPRQPEIAKAFGLKKLEDSGVLNFVESLFKIKFKDDHLFFGMMTEMEIFKGPCKTILNGSAIDEPMMTKMEPWSLLVRNLVIIFMELLRREMGLKSETEEGL